MALGDAFRSRLQALRRAGADVPRIMAEVNQGATIRAIEETAENTPASVIRGVNAVSGALRAHWSTDSVTTPVWNGRNCDTFLKNNMQYALYVNNGHRMDRHFTSHLAIEGGQLTGKPAGDGGLMVGTRTTYIPGVYMVEKGKDKWKQVVEFELDKAIRERFKK